MNKAQAKTELTKLGLELSEDSGKGPLGFFATIDCIGRNSYGPDCRGHNIHDYTATAAEFWYEVVNEARYIAKFIEPCPYPVGECEFHDA